MHVGINHFGLPHGGDGTAPSAPATEARTGPGQPDVTAGDLLGLANYGDGEDDTSSSSSSSSDSDANDQPITSFF